MKSRRKCNMKKRLAMLVLAGAMVTSSLTGCGLKDSATVATVAGDEIPAGLANFYARMTQAQYESMYSSYLGENMWTTEASEGKTYEKLVKDEVLKDLENMYLLEDHMDDYKISLSDDEKKAIKDVAKEFSKDNDKDDKEKVSGDTEYVERYLTLVTIKQKMTDAIEAEADTNVTDDEAKQKAMQYVLFSINTTDANGVYQSLSDEEKANVKANAEAFAEGAKETSDFEGFAQGQGYTVSEESFDGEGSASVPEALAKAADALDEGGVTDCIETDNGYYVAKVTSLFDQEATEEKKQTIISQRKQDKYDEVIKGWRKKGDISVKKSVWKKVDFNDLKVTLHTEDSEKSTDSAN